MKRNVENICFIAHFRARIHRMRMIMDYKRRRGNFGYRMRDHVWERDKKHLQIEIKFGKV